MPILIWDTTPADPNTSGGAGRWDNINLNFDDGTGTHVLFTDGDSVIFGGTGGLVDLRRDVIVNDMTFNVTGYGIGGTGTLNMMAGATITNNTGSAFGIGPSFVGSNDFNLVGDFIFSGAHTTTGTMTLSGGKLTMGFFASLAGDLVIAADGELQANGGSQFGDVSVVGTYRSSGTQTGTLSLEGLIMADNRGVHNAGAGQTNAIVGNGLDNSYTNFGIVTGDADFGAGNDTMWNSRDFNGNVAFGLGDDSLEVNNNGTITGRILGGRGDDDFLIRSGGEVSGRIFGGRGNDNLEVQAGGTLGGAFSGGLGNDTVMGSDKRDKLQGDAGRDVINGGAGRDFINGGADADELTGGADADDFIYRDLSEMSDARRIERITDFTQGEDRIVLSKIDADTTLAGNQAFTFIGTAAFSGTAGEMRYVQLNGGTRVLFDDDGDGVADAELRLDGTINLTEFDFAL